MGIGVNIKSDNSVAVYFTGDMSDVQIYQIWSFSKKDEKTLDKHLKDVLIKIKRNENPIKGEVKSENIYPKRREKAFHLYK